MFDRPVYVHVGVRKTGTTSLQQALFNRHSEIYAVTKPFAEKSSEERFFRSLIEDDRLQYSHTDLEGHLSKISQKVKYSSARAVVFSDQLLADANTVTDRLTVAERIRALIPDARIIITIREQCDNLLSDHLNHLRLYKNVPPSLARYPVPIDEHIEFAFRAPYYSRILSTLDYDALIHAYERLFGVNMVYVGLFEELRAAPEKYYRELAKFLDVDTDESIRIASRRHERPRKRDRRMMYFKIRNAIPLDVPFRRIVPEWLSSSLDRYLERGPSLQGVIPSPLAGRLEDYYREGNKRLAERRNLPLAIHGYAL